METKGKIFLVAAALLLATNLSGQSFYDWKIDRKMVLSLGLGAATYYGDIASELNWMPSTGQLAVKYHTINRLWLRAEASVYWIEGSDLHLSRDLRFGSRNIEFSIIGDYSLFPTKKPYYRRKWFNPYVFLGLGLTYYNPKATVDGERQALRPLAREGVSYGPIAPVVPAGLGFRIKVNYVFDLAFEGGFRYTFTDYLDDVSKRGNPDSNDLYWIMVGKIETYLPYDLFTKRSNKPRVKMFRKFKNTMYE